MSEVSNAEDCEYVTSELAYNSATDSVIDTDDLYGIELSPEFFANRDIDQPIMSGHPSACVASGDLKDQSYIQHPNISQDTLARARLVLTRSSATCAKFGKWSPTRFVLLT